MYEYITGRLIELNPADCTVECGGFGYRILISLNTYSKLQNAGEEFPHEQRQARSKWFFEVAGLAKRGERLYSGVN